MAREGHQNSKVKRQGLNLCLGLNLFIVPVNEGIRTIPYGNIVIQLPVQISLINSQKRLKPEQPHHMLRHIELSDQQLHSRIRKGQIKWAGNQRLKIYGTLECWSGKRMLRHNRVFFTSEDEALAAGYRACKHCLKRR